MKRFDVYFIYFFTLSLLTFCALAAAGVLTVPQFKQDLPKSTIYQKEQLTQHAIWLKKGPEAQGLCTGTAVGPHAILLASHCIEREQDNLTIDLALETHDIIATVADGRDHTLLLIDGTPFTFTESVQMGTAAVGDTVTLYGVGGEAYPPVPKYGKVTNCEDPSDMDIKAGEFCTSTHVSPGDSGSAVFNIKGEIVGLTTYSDPDTYPTSSRDFRLDFTQKQLDQATMFDGKDVPKETQ